MCKRSASLTVESIAPETKKRVNASNRDRARDASVYSTRNSSDLQDLHLYIVGKVKSTSRVPRSMAVCTSKYPSS